MRKKLFISCPMRGRNKEDIEKCVKKMHKIAEAVFEQELEALYVRPEDTPPTDRDALRSFAESVSMMSMADYYVGINDYWEYVGCSIQNNIANAYTEPERCCYISKYNVFSENELKLEECVPEKSAPTETAIQELQSQKAE